VGPAGAAVLGEMLVPHISEIVDPIGVVPNEVFRKGYIGEGLLKYWLDGLSALLSACQVTRFQGYGPTQEKDDNED
jgi:hypothetical protein